MTDIVRSLWSFRLLDELSRKTSPVHRIHPVSKLLVTLAFLVAIASAPKRELVGLLPFALYPVLVASLADVPFRAVAGRLLAVAPLIIGVGALNPLFDRSPVAFGPFVVGGGWLVFLSLVVKGILTVSAAIILVATTGMDGIAEAMRTLRLPRIIVLQVRLTYRYLSLLLEELGRVVRAYELRAPGRRGIGASARGSLPGHLLIRTYARAQRVYDAMLLRGFDGEYRSGKILPFRSGDAAYAVLWTLFFFAVRSFDLPALLGSLALRAIG